MQIADAAAAENRLVQHRAARAFLDVLPEVADRQLLRDRNLALVGHFFAGDQAEQRRLAGSVRADQADGLSGIELKRGVDEKNLPAVLLADAGQRNHATFQVYRRVSGRSSLFACNLTRCPSSFSTVCRWRSDSCRSLDEATLRIERGERVSIVGRNGAGKSTLLRIVSGEQAPDTGSVWKEPGLRMARLEQDVAFSTDRTVFEVVAEGLGELSHLVADYHRTAVAVAEASTPTLLEKLGRLQHDLEELDGWRIEQRVELVLSRLNLPSDVRVDTLSGGWKRRVLLARALVAVPDVLLLDEPTNHLDLDAITWLETFLSEYQGAVVFVTHDRTFLQRVATRIVEIDRGQLTSWPGDYANVPAQERRMAGQ